MEDADYILFEKYLSHNLSEEEIKAFELRLKAEPEFSDEFKLYRETSGFLEKKYNSEEELQSFKGNLKDISDKYFINKTSSRNSFIWWKIAAAAFILIFAGIYFFYQSSLPLYQEFADHGLISLAERGNNKEQYYKAEKAYNAGNYVEAKKYLEEIIKNEEANQEIKLYYAISLIETEEYLKAKEILDEISNTHSVYRYEAVWYKALSMLKQKEYKQSTEILKTIPKGEARYSEAQKLLDKIE